MTHGAIIITREMIVMRNTILHEVRRSRNEIISKKRMGKGNNKGQRLERAGKDRGDGGG